ncbi:MAG: glycosyltransferase [Clostridia bacterium]|nr:glycosyltransferase [Clostridia bacterium]
MIKILFLINTLGGGGAEKALVNLVNNMDGSAFDITVETMFGGGVNASQLNSGIKYIGKNAPCPKGIAYIFRFFSAKRLYNYFIGNEKYDILVAFMHGAPVKVISGCPDKNTKKIAWLHNGNPETGTFFRFWHSKKSAFKAYSECDAVAGVSESVSDAFGKYTGIRDIKTVYNTNDVSNIISLAGEECRLPFKNSAPVICSVGRTVKEKGFDRLIDVAVRLHSEGLDFNLLIVGDGDRYKDLAAKVRENGAKDYIYLPGYDTNPYKYLAKSDMFVCSSFTEGLSTALTEAVILGLPCVSTDVPGAKEVLGENGEYGIVTGKTDDELYNGIKALLSDESLREHYAEKAEERSAFFNTENTVKQAEELFRKVFDK